jgi:hypothetical protein
MRTSFLLAVIALVAGSVAIVPKFAESQTNTVRSARELSVDISARPLGIWCDGVARFTVGISNGGRRLVYVGTPRTADATFPYKSNVSLALSNGTGAGGGRGCGCSGGADCELCGKPDIVATLNPQQELTWTMEFSQLRLSEGPASFRATLYWYGGVRRDDGFQQKMTGDAEASLMIQRVDDRCFLARVATNPAG